MQQIRTVWAGMDMRKRVALAGAAVAVLLCLLALLRIAAAPSMTLLYAGLEAGVAGDVVRALDQRGVSYEIRGGAIYVPAPKRDELRMTLAAEGLPANNGKGYELLDTLNGFGTTAQMFDAAYWRAKEGELARTIVSSPAVSQARVHIANGSANPFQRKVNPTASVSLVPSGVQISAEQAKAIQFLVASAISGMSPENVTVIDANGTILGSREAVASGGGPIDKASEIRERVLRLVEARVGQGNAVVEVSVETITETESVRERRVDPDSRVAISTDVEERSDSSRNRSSEVTVASNLPDGDAAAGDQSNSTANETRERVNYEVSETEVEVHRLPGAIKRLTVAVLVNGTTVTDASGAEVFEPLAQEDLDALKELVASAVGFDAERGDVITLKSLKLPEARAQGAVAASSIWQNLRLDVMSLIQTATLAIVALILGVFVIRPILAGRAAERPVPVGALPNSGALSQDTPALVGEITAGDGSGAESGAVEQAVVPTQAPVPVIAARDSENAVERLRAMIGDKQEETVEILRSWLEESEERV